MPRNFGWLSVPGESERVATLLGVRSFTQAHPSLMGQGKNRTVLLYRAAERVMGQPLDAGPQRSGDCTGWAMASAIDLRASAEVEWDQPEIYGWERRACVEWIYAIGREIGDYLGDNGGGCMVAWAAMAVRRFGVIGRHALGQPYVGTRSDRWGKTGAPRKFLKIARVHRAEVLPVHSYDEACDAIAAGRPVVVGSNVGFEGKRDKQGFIRRREVWHHALVFVGLRSDRGGGLLVKNHSGPQEHKGEPMGPYEIPDSSWWVHPPDAAAMIRCQDCWCVTGFSGYRD